MANKSVAILMADYGHDPTETAVPYQVFRRAGFSVTFVTEHGRAPECDTYMLTGWTQRLLGAAAPVIATYKEMSASPEWKKPIAWSDPGFSLTRFDLVFLPGGHDKAVRQILDSASVQRLLAQYFPLTARSRGADAKYCAAVCHGVQVLAHAKDSTGKSVLHDVATTALPGIFESSAYQSTRLFLGDYYKTYGAGSPNVEDYVKEALDAPSEQWRSSANPATPFVVEDEQYNYLSGRWPGDAEALAKRVVALMNA
jgi:putative intracellular protease/amidase